MPFIASSRPSSSPLVGDVAGLLRSSRRAASSGSWPSELPAGISVEIGAGRVALERDEQDLVGVGERDDEHGRRHRLHDAVDALLPVRPDDRVLAHADPAVLVDDP